MGAKERERQTDRERERERKQERKKHSQIRPTIKLIYWQKRIKGKLFNR